MMRSVLEHAARRFKSEEHLRNVLAAGEFIPLHAEDGTELAGIRGKVGAYSMSCSGHEIGCDMIEMDPGTEFPLHIHPGDHVLFVLPDSAPGYVHIDGVDRLVVPGDTIFIAAEHPHGVKTKGDEAKPLRFLAFGHPHKHVSAKDRMHVVEEE